MRYIVKDDWYAISSITESGDLPYAATADFCNRIQDSLSVESDIGFRSTVGPRGNAVILNQEERAPEATRCVIVVDGALPSGRAANAAAVIALTLGKRHPRLAGPDLVDGSGCIHPGLIPIGIAVLAAPAPELGAVRAKALKDGIDVVDFPVQGQQTTDYAAFLAQVREVATETLAYVGVGLYGRRKVVGRIVGRFSLLR
jgi:hypothetical protein